MTGMDMSSVGQQSGGMTGADMSGASPTASAGAGAATASRAGGSSFASPDSIYGLKPAKGPRPVVRFEDAMGLAVKNNFDLKIAQERLYQTGLFVRRAWSSVLPRLNATVGYQFSWPKSEFKTMSQEALDGQVDGQKAQLEGQAQVYDAQAAAAHADGNYNTEYANRAMAARLRTQKDAIQYQDAPDPISINPVNQLNGQLQATFILFNARALPAILNAYDAVKQVKATLNRAQTQALYMAAMTYYTAVSTRRFVEIAQRQVENLEHHLQATRVRVEVGALPVLALRRAEVDLTRARSSLRTAQGGYQSAVGGLAMIIGLDSEFDVGSLPPLPRFEETFSPDDLIARALHGRPDITANRVALDIAERGRLDAVAQWFPLVTLTGVGRATSNTSGFTKDPVSYAVVVNASIPLYDGGERYTSFRQANSKVREAKLVLEQSLQKLELSVRGNVRELELRKANLVNQRESVALATAAAKDTRARFDVGAATNLEVLDAEQLVVAAEMDLANAETELELSRLALAFVVGAFDPVLSEPGQRLPASLNPLVGLGDVPPLSGPGSVVPPGTQAWSVPRAPAPVAPALAPPGRVITGAAPIPLKPSALDLIRSGLVD
jgi:outer membrane protein